MANAHRGEIAWSFEGKTYTFKVTNQGKVAAEEYTDLKGQDLQRAMGPAGLDWGQIRTALFQAVTRKYHVKDFPNETVINSFLDDFDDAVQEKAEDESVEAGREMNIDLQASLLAAFNRQDKARMTKYLNGKDPDEDEESPEESTEGEGPKEAPSDTPKKPNKKVENEAA